MVRTQDGRSHPGPENRMCKTRSQSHLVTRFLMRKYDRRIRENTRDDRVASRRRAYETPRGRRVPPRARPARVPVRVADGCMIACMEIGVHIRTVAVTGPG